MKLPAHLHYNGNCREAFGTYAEIFGGQIEFAMSCGEMPGGDRTAPDRDRLAHARVRLGGGEHLLGCDPSPERYQKPQGYNVMTLIEEPKEAGRVFNRLCERGGIVMPFQQTFWAYRFGMCMDRFDIPWMVNCEKAP
jgi:PhnB protein